MDKDLLYMNKEQLLAKMLECNTYIGYAVRKCLSKEDAEKYQDYRLSFTEEKGEEPDQCILTLSLRAPDMESNAEEGSWQYQLTWKSCDNITVLNAGYRHVWHQWQAAVLFHGIPNLLKQSS